MLLPHGYQTGRESGGCSELAGAAAFSYTDAVHRHPRIPAFTVIEVLIVIAIVGLLIAISLPGLGAARARAKEAHCVAIIRNAHGLVAMYAADASDLPPHGGYQPGSLATGEPAVRLMYTHTGIEVAYFNQTHLWTDVVANWQGEAVVGATCPSTKDSSHAVSPPPDAHGGTGNASSYYVSAAYFADPAFWQPTPVHRESHFITQRVATTRFPSDKALLYEHHVRHIDGHGLTPLSAMCKRSPVAFTDGHASVRPFRGVEAVHAIHDVNSPMPHSHTPNGVLGRDVQSP